MNPGDIVISRMTGDRYEVEEVRPGGYLIVRGVRTGLLIERHENGFEEPAPEETRAIEEREARDESNFQAGKEAGHIETQNRNNQ
jgi:hypothetical protein